jgi:hypothetical protein
VFFLTNPAANALELLDDVLFFFFGGEDGVTDDAVVASLRLRLLLRRFRLVTS